MSVRAPVVPDDRREFLRSAIELVPRFRHGGYREADVAARRCWIEERTSVRLEHVGATSLPTASFRGNAENVVGVAQVPLGLAGPLLVHGSEGSRTYFVPLATSEGALVRSYERGMVALTRAGGASAHVLADENIVCPVFMFVDLDAARRFAAEVPSLFDGLAAAAQATTRHGVLLDAQPCVIGREVIVTFRFSTGDAHGMNMITRATDSACRWLLGHSAARSFHIFSGSSSEKRASGSLFAPGKGKKVVAGARLPAAIVKTYLHVTPAQLVDVWHHAVIGHLQANAVGCNAQIANGLTALFIACGQDVANVANAAVGITNFELTAEGDLYASVSLPSLTVATVGGGTALGTSRECLALLGCVGSGTAVRLAEIAAAAALAGELSMTAAIASGEFVTAHEQYGRNRPEPVAPPEAGEP